MESHQRRRMVVRNFAFAKNLIWELDLVAVTTIQTKRAFTLDGNKITWSTRRLIMIERASIEKNTNQDGIGTASTYRD